MSSVTLSAGAKYIVRVLGEAAQERKETARLLRISLSSLYRKIGELEIF